MGRRSVSSRRQFEEYRDEVRQQKRDPSEIGGSPHSAHRKPHKRQRTTGTLIARFWGLLQGQRSTIVFALCTSTVATLLALIPPAATKFVVDNVLSDKPLPEYLTNNFSVPRDRWDLLFLIVSIVLAVSLVKMGLHIWGRWYATRTNKRIQMSVRKKVFEHAIRLPLYRVQEIKSGGAASILREDAGSVGDLVFGMLYNPWRAVIQLLGSMCILAWVDWRLLLGALILVPLVYVTHRTWINRIRPQYRDVRARREQIDAHAAEAFGGIRVVRAFSRQQSEAIRFLRNNHLMGRQELFVWWWARTIEMIWEALIPLGSAGLLLYGGWQVSTLR